MKITLVFLDIAEIRDDQIDAEHVAVRECHSAVEDEHIAVALKNGEMCIRDRSSPASFS